MGEIYFIDMIVIDCSCQGNETEGPNKARSVPYARIIDLFMSLYPAMSDEDAFRVVDGVRGVVQHGAKP